MKVPLYVFPLGVTLTTPLCCFLPYLFAIYYSQAHPWLPYISDSGGLLPQSSLFSQLLDINAIFIAFCSYISYKLNQKFVQKEKIDEKRRKLSFLNKSIITTGFLVSMGTVIMGNYRMTELRFGHGFGVVLGFGSAILHMILLGIFTHLTAEEDNRRVFWSRVRLFCGLLSLLTTFSVLLFGFLSILMIGSFKKFWETEFRLKWSTEGSDVTSLGFHFHWLSSLNEWTAVLTLCPFFWSLSDEFKDRKWSEVMVTGSQQCFDSNLNSV